MKSYLLIGGPADGRRVEMAELPDQFLIHVVATREKMDEPLKIQEFSYKPHHIWSGSNAVIVFVWGNMSLLDILTRLVEGYHKV